MNELVQDFGISPPTWFFLSFLLVVAVYFKFTRFWALRNLDLLALLCLTPGWLLILAAKEPGNAQYATLGYLWLIAGSGWWLVRMLLDPLLRRRPQLEPNMSPGGLTVIGVAVLGSFVTHILVSSLAWADLVTVQQGAAEAAPEQAEAPSAETATSLESEGATQVGADSEEATAGVILGPGWQLFELFGVLPRDVPPQPALAQKRDHEGAETPEAEPVESAAQPPQRYQFTLRSVLILAHCAIVIGLVLVAVCHFGKLVTGVGIAVLYLLLPYTAYHMQRIDQVVLGALLVWTVAAYRYPILCGILLAVAGAAFYFPLFLLPLWAAFYWKRGVRSFCIAVGSTVTLLLVAGAVTGNLADVGAYAKWVGGELAGHAWRIPVFVTYLVLCGALALGSKPKNLGTLIAHSAVVLLGTQFWYVPLGGGYVLWYLPLVLLVVFRPNLKGRVMAPAGTENGEIVSRDARMAAA